MSATACFREVDLSKPLAPTTPESKRYSLFSGGWPFWQPPPPLTTPETSATACFQGVWPPFGNHHHPQPPKTSATACFQEVDLSLATNTTHHPRKQAWRLIFGRLTLPGNHYHPQLPKMSATAHFWEVHLSLATTTTHNPWKQVRQLVFGRLSFLWLPPPPKNKPSHLFSWSLCLAL